MIRRQWNNTNTVHASDHRNWPTVGRLIYQEVIIRMTKATTVFLITHSIIDKTPESWNTCVGVCVRVYVCTTERESTYVRACCYPYAKRHKVPKTFDKVQTLRLIYVTDKDGKLKIVPLAKYSLFHPISLAREQDGLCIEISGNVHRRSSAWFHIYRLWM